MLERCPAKTRTGRSQNFQGADDFFQLAIAHGDGNIGAFADDDFGIEWAPKVLHLLINFVAKSMLIQHPHFAGFVDNSSSQCPEAVGRVSGCYIQGMRRGGGELSPVRLFQKLSTPLAILPPKLP